LAGLIDEVDARVNAGEADGGEVRDGGEVGLAVEVVGDAGEGIDTGDLGGCQAVGEGHFNDVFAGVRGGDGVVFYEDGEAAAGGEIANLGGGERPRGGPRRS